MAPPVTDLSSGMAVSFCKWPVITGCIIGGIIVLSCVWCLIRCCMCGYACCSCCCGGCGGGRRRRDDDPPPPPPPPIYLPPAYREEPQYAYSTDRNGNVHGDSLPAMPTWETTKVAVKEEVELDEVNNEVYKKKPSPSAEPYSRHATPQRGLAPTLDAYGQQPPAQRMLTPGPIPAPIPVNPAAHKMGFNPRGTTPMPYQHEDRNPVQGQIGSRWENQGPPTRGPYDHLYQEGQPLPAPQQYEQNADYYSSYARQDYHNRGGSGGGGHPTYDDSNRRQQNPWSVL